MTIHPHVVFSGQCKEAFQRYAAILGGKITFSFTYGDTPMAARTPAEWHDKIAHMRLQVGNQMILGADAPPDRYRSPAGCSMMLEVETVDEATRVFNALAEQGQVDMPLQETFWAHRYGSCTDRFGIVWMINCGKPLEDLASSMRKGSP